jgi:hypothetical protein
MASLDTLVDQATFPSFLKAYIYMCVCVCVPDTTHLLWLFSKGVVVCVDVVNVMMALQGQPRTRCRGAVRGGLRKCCSFACVFPVNIWVVWSGSVRFGLACAIGSARWIVRLSHGSSVDHLLVIHAQCPAHKSKQKTKARRPSHAPTHPKQKQTEIQ